MSEGCGLGIIFEVIIRNISSTDKAIFADNLSGFFTPQYLLLSKIPQAIFARLVYQH